MRKQTSNRKQEFMRVILRCITIPVFFSGLPGVLLTIFTRYIGSNFSEVDRVYPASVQFLTHVYSSLPGLLPIPRRCRYNYFPRAPQCEKVVYLNKDRNLQLKNIFDFTILYTHLLHLPIATEIQSQGIMYTLSI